MTASATAADVGQRLVEFCREGQHMQAIEELYADTVVSVEAVPMEGMPQTMEGIEAIRGKNTWWAENNEVHRSEVLGPFPHGEDRFAVMFTYESTFKPTGERMNMQEVALYTVADGKVVKEEFFYKAG